jgi:hypothetical protein
MSRAPGRLDELCIRQHTESECTVLVWRTGKLFEAWRRSGHVALLLRRRYDEGPWRVCEGQVPRYDDDLVRYLSFRPLESGLAAWDQGSSMGFGDHFRRRPGDFVPHHLIDYAFELGPRARCALERGEKPREGQISIGTEQNERGSNPGKKMWGRTPQGIVSLPGLTPLRPRRLGLDLRGMIAWAHRFKAGSDFHYRYVSASSNCAGIARLALAAGGAAPFLWLGAFLKVGPLYRPPTLGYPYLTPNHVLEYARQLERGINYANQMLGALETLSLASENRGDATAKPDDEVDGGALARLIQRYRNLNWREHHPEKMAVVVTMLSAAHQRLRRRRDTNLFGLARLALGAVEEAAALAGEAWDPRPYYGDVRLPASHCQAGHPADFREPRQPVTS